MSVAFFGPSNRGHATQAALLLARGLAKQGPVRFVRVRLPGDPALPTERAHGKDFDITDLAALDAASASASAMEAVATESGRLVLDLPAALVQSAPLRTVIGLPILAVGPAPLDEMAAAEAYACAARTGGTDGQRATTPAWLLGCDRSGGEPAAQAFGEDLRILAEPLTGEPIRVLPCVLPPLVGPRAYWLIHGAPDRRCDEVSTALAAVVASALLFPEAASLPTPQNSLLDRDGRPPEARLRALADDLAALDAGAAPTADDLSRAPVLDDWSYDTRPRRVLTGIVSEGHPDFRAGRRITTSEIFASDGRSFGRTLSRWYRLGTPKRP